MMASKMLSRLLPVAEGDVSVYESMRRDAASRMDIEAQRNRGTHTSGMNDDSDDGHDHGEPHDDDEMLYDASVDPRLYHDNLASPPFQPSSATSPLLEHTKPRWKSKSKVIERVEEDEDVPESLLLDGKPRPGHTRETTQRETVLEESLPALVTKPAGSAHSPQRRAARNQSGATPAMPAHSAAQAEAMWLYTNASHLDAFLLEVYQYYVQHGIWSILLGKVINQLTGLFVFTFAMFLSTCIDYSKIPSSKSITEVMIPKCMSHASWVKNVALFTFVMYWLYTTANDVRSVRRLFQMHNFFLHVLGISDDDIQTVSWVRVVDGLVKVQNAHVETANPPARIKKYLDYNKPQQRLNAESIANRLMRQANYYVAMYNKDILDFTLPVPFLGDRHFYSKNLEWSIDFCLTNFIFDEQGSIRPFCLDVKNRSALVEALRMRLRFTAVTSVILAPLNILRFCIMYFFRYYTEFTRNPSRVSARTFTPFAEWKIREFNELDHLFERRLRQAHPFAIEYLKQFPKDKLDQTWRFVAFVSGAIAAVLTIATLLDPELFLGFEVTPGRTAVFWLTLMVGIFGVAHGSLPDETEVHDPVLHLREVLMYTHYMPAHWKTRLHSNEVRSEFSSLYQMKIVIFLEEIISLVLAPWIIWRNSGHRCERLIDFFREHTVHVDGIGNQCNFAVFGFKKDLNIEDPAAVLQEPDGLRDDYYGLKDDKMAASMQNFAQYYSHYNNRQINRRTPGWQPPPIWPRMLSDNIAEDEGIGYMQNGPSARADLFVRGTSSRRSVYTDGRRRQTSPLMPRSQHLANRSGKRHQSATKRAGQEHSHGGRGISESRLMAQDSDLDDYAKAVGRDEFDSEGADGVAKALGGNAGVLGMLYQFSKAQTEKGTGLQL